MSVKLRLARWGANKKPYYHIVAADSRSPRDGKFLETIGKYDPMLPKENEKRYTIEKERAQYWLKQGAVPTETVYSILAKFGLVEKKDFTLKTKKSQPKAKAQERMKANAKVAEYA